MDKEKIIPIHTRFEPSLPIPKGGNTMPKSVGRFFDNLTESKSGRPFLETLVTKKQLAVSLALSQSYLSKLMVVDGLPHFKIGRAVRFRVSEVAAWLQKRSQP